MPAADARPYRVLARTYRPVRLSELVGQDALVRTLTHAFASNRVAHGFMLTGIRGIGKTTTARIIARALNCVGSDGNGAPTPEPCGVCDQCVSIGEGRHIDVLELDAASHTGINDIREIIDGVRYAPSSGRYKVYIVDEVHMLSPQAFNGLLKTLEEPPPHVKFVFATTEIRKVPVTVLSRCQRFDLRRVAPEVMTGHLQTIAAAEAVEVEPDALALIVRCAEGSVRDALSLLDQAIALGGSPVRAAEVQDMLGLADRGRVLDLFDALMAGEPQTALARLDELDRLGVDPVALVQDLLDLCHGLTRVKLVPEAVAALGLGPGDAERAAAMAGRLSLAVLARCWQMLLKGMDDLRLAPLPLQAVEMLLIRLAFAADLPTPDRLGRTGPAIEEPSPAAPVATRISSGAGTAAAVRVARAEPEAESDPAASSPPITSFATAVEALRAREPMLASWLRQSVHEVRFEPGRIELRLQANVPADLPSRIGAALGRITGRRWVVVVSNDAGQATLAEQHDARRAELLARAAQHPTVKSLLERYPGATLEDVRPAD